MDPTVIIAAIQLISVLEPAAIALINKLVDNFDKSSNPQDLLEQIKATTAQLKPMVLKP